MYSELRAAYEVTKATGTEVIIGSNAFFSPEKFIQELAGLKKEEDADTDEPDEKGKSKEKASAKKTKKSGSEEEEEESD
jgi:hypothetical protein